MGSKLKGYILTPAKFSGDGVWRTSPLPGYETCPTTLRKAKYIRSCNIQIYTYIAQKNVIKCECF